MADGTHPLAYFTDGHSALPSKSTESWVAAECRHFKKELQRSVKLQRCGYFCPPISNAIDKYCLGVDQLTDVLEVYFGREIALFSATRRRMTVMACLSARFLAEHSPQTF